MPVIQRIQARWSRFDDSQRFSIAALLCLVGCALAFGWLLKVTVYQLAQEREDDLTGRFVRHQVAEHLSTDLFRNAELLQDEKLGEQLLDALYFEDLFRVKIYGPDGRILWSDESELIGRLFPDNEFLSRALRGEVVSVIEIPHRTEHEFERGTFGQIMETYVPIQEAGAVVGVIEVYRHPEAFFRRVRRSVWILWLATFVGGTVLFLAMVGGVRRINNAQQRLQNRLRRSAAKLQTEKGKLEGIVNAIGAGLLLVDREGRIRWANRNAKSWFPHYQNLIGSTSYGGLCNLEEPCQDCPFRANSSPKFPVYCEPRVTSPSGQDRVLHIVTTPEPIDSDAGPQHFLQLILDVTEQKTVEAQLQQATKMSLVGQLGGGLAHQINNPVGILVTTITHHLSTKDANSLPADLRSDLEMLERQCRRIDHCVKSLLSFSRVSEGLRVPVDIKEVIDEALLLTSPRMKQSSVQLDVHLDERPCVSMGDPNELLQVVLNVVNNAIDAMPEGGRLAIDLHIVSPEQRPDDNGKPALLLRFSDTGHGIPQELTQRIFEPFFTTREAGSGTGIGLAVTKRILKSVEGTILAENSPGAGAMFTIELPAVESQDGA